MNTGNEVELIRAQLTAERQHASTVANACATAFGRRNAVALSSGSSLEEFQQACVDYLVRVLAWFEERDQRLTDLWHARPTAAEAGRRTLEDTLASPGRSREALEKLVALVGIRGQRARGEWLVRGGAGGRRLHPLRVGQATGAGRGTAPAARGGDPGGRGHGQRSDRGARRRGGRAGPAVETLPRIDRRESRVA